MAEDTAVAKSQTTPDSQTEGKECILGRFMTEQEGQRILDAADTWIGTPYASVGSKSEKGSKGDCSGTTNKIYVEAGFPYPYQTTATFIALVEKTSRFREIDLSAQQLQAGDVLWWPGHVAIYAPFPEGHPRRDTGLKKAGKPKVNNMYTAFNDRTGVPYGPYNSEVFRRDRYRAFRYFFRPGELPC